MKHFNKIIEIISMRRVQIGVIVILLMYVFIYLLMMKAYPFADLFSSFGGFSVPHNNTELNPIIKENQISALKTDVKVPQVEKLNAGMMVKVFKWHESRARPIAHPLIDLKAASMCDGIEIPILVIDGGETAFIGRSIGTQNDINWNNYPKVSDIGMTTRFGYRTTLKDILAEISRPKLSNTPLKYRPIPTLTQGEPNVYEPPALEHIDDNSLMFNENNNDQYMAPYNPCLNNLCNELQVVDRPHFPTFDVQFFQ